MVTDMDKYHKLYGKHSNIPECCIDWWIHKWLNVFRNPIENQKHRQKTVYVERTIKKIFNYIPCPTCLKKKHRHKLHECQRKTCTKFQKQLKKKTGHTFPFEKYAS